MQKSRDPPQPRGAVSLRAKKPAGQTNTHIQTHTPCQDGDSGLRRIFAVLEHDVQDGDPVGAKEAVHPLAARYRDLGRGLAPLLSMRRVVVGHPKYFCQQQSV